MSIGSSMMEALSNPAAAEQEDDYLTYAQMYEQARLTNLQKEYDSLCQSVSGLSTPRKDRKVLDSVAKILSSPNYKKLLLDENIDPAIKSTLMHKAISDAGLQKITPSKFYSPKDLSFGEIPPDSLLEVKPNGDKVIVKDWSKFEPEEPSFTKEATDLAGFLSGANPDRKGDLMERLAEDMRRVRMVSGLARDLWHSVSSGNAADLARDTARSIQRASTLDPEHEPVINSLGAITDDEEEFVNQLANDVKNDFSPDNVQKMAEELYRKNAYGARSRGLLFDAGLKMKTASLFVDHLSDSVSFFTNIAKEPVKVAASSYYKMVNNVFQEYTEEELATMADDTAYNLTHLPGTIIEAVGSDYFDAVADSAINMDSHKATTWGTDMALYAYAAPLAVAKNVLFDENFKLRSFADMCYTVGPSAIDFGLGWAGSKMAWGKIGKRASASSTPILKNVGEFISAKTARKPEGTTFLTKERSFGRKPDPALIEHNEWGSRVVEEFVKSELGMKDGMTSVADHWESKKIPEIDEKLNALSDEINTVSGSIDNLNQELKIKAQSELANLQARQAEVLAEKKNAVETHKLVREAVRQMEERDFQFNKLKDGTITDEARGRREAEIIKAGDLFEDDIPDWNRQASGVGTNAYSVALGTEVLEQLGLTHPDGVPGIVKKWKTSTIDTILKDIADGSDLVARKNNYSGVTDAAVMDATRKRPGSESGEVVWRHAPRDSEALGSSNTTKVLDPVTGKSKTVSMNRLRQLGQDATLTEVAEMVGNALHESRHTVLTSGDKIIAISNLGKSTFVLKELFKKKNIVVDFDKIPIAIKGVLKGIFTPDTRLYYKKYYGKLYDNAKRAGVWNKEFFDKIDRDTFINRGISEEVVTYAVTELNSARNLGKDHKQIASDLIDSGAVKGVNKWQLANEIKSLFHVYDIMERADMIRRGRLDVALGAGVEGKATTGRSLRISAAKIQSGESRLTIAEHATRIKDHYIAEGQRLGRDLLGEANTILSEERALRDNFWKQVSDEVGVDKLGEVQNNLLLGNKYGVTNLVASKDAPLYKRVEMFDENYRLKGDVPKEILDLKFTDKKARLNVLIYGRKAHPIHGFIADLSEQLGIKASTAKKFYQQNIEKDVLKGMGHKSTVTLHVSDYNTLMDGVMPRIQQISKDLHTLASFRLSPKILRDWRSSEKRLGDIDAIYTLATDFGLNPMTGFPFTMTYKDLIHSYLLSFGGLKEAAQAGALGFITSKVSKEFGVFEMVQGTKRMADILRRIEAEWGNYNNTALNVVFGTLDSTAVRAGLKKIGVDRPIKYIDELTPDEINRLGRAMDIRYDTDSIHGSIYNYFRQADDVITEGHAGAILNATIMDEQKSRLLPYKTYTLGLPVEPFGKLLKTHKLSKELREAVGLRALIEQGDREIPAEVLDKYNNHRAKLSRETASFEIREENRLHEIKRGLRVEPGAVLAGQPEVGTYTMTMDKIVDHIYEHFVKPSFEIHAKEFGFKVKEKGYFPEQISIDANGGKGVNISDRSSFSPFRKKKRGAIDYNKLEVDFVNVIDNYISRSYYDKYFSRLESVVNTLGTITFTRGRAEGGSGAMTAIEKKGIIPKQATQFMMDTLRMARGDLPIAEVKAAESLIYNLPFSRAPISIRIGYSMIKAVDKGLGWLFKEENWFPRQVKRMIEEQAGKSRVDPYAMREIIRMVRKATSAFVLWGRLSVPLQQIFQTTTTAVLSGTPSVVKALYSKGVKDPQGSMQKIQKYELDRLTNVAEIVFGGNIKEELGVGNLGATKVRRLAARYGAFWWDILHTTDFFARDASARSAYFSLNDSGLFGKFRSDIKVTGEEVYRKSGGKLMYSADRIMYKKHLLEAERYRNQYSEASAMGYPEKKIAAFKDRMNEALKAAEVQYAIGQAALANYYYDSMHGMRLFGLSSLFGQMKKFGAGSMNGGYRLMKMMAEEIKTNGGLKGFPDLITNYKEGRLKATTASMRMLGREATTKSFGFLGGYCLLDAICTSMAKIIDPDAEVHMARWIPQIIDFQTPWQTDPGFFLYTAQKGFAGPAFSMAEDGLMYTFGIASYLAGIATGDEQVQNFAKQLTRMAGRNLKDTVTPAIFSKYVRFGIEMVGGSKVINVNPIDMVFGNLLGLNDPMKSWGVSRMEERGTDGRLNAIFRLLSIYNYESEKEHTDLEKKVWKKMVGAIDKRQYPTYDEIMSGR